MKRFGIFEKLYLPVADEEEVVLPASQEEESEGEEEGDSDEEDEEEDETPEQDPVEVAQALEIFKALNNKESAPAMMAFLNAKLAQNGLAPVTAREIKETISVKDILKKGFGEEYAFLEEKMSPALEEAINSVVEAKIGSSLTELREANQNLQREIASTKISAALDPIIEEMGAEEFDKIAADLSATMNRYPNNSNLPLKVYIRDMIKMVDNQKKAPARTEKERKNIREAKRTLPNGVEKSKVKIGSRTPTLRESIIAATKGITFEND